MMLLSCLLDCIVSDRKSAHSFKKNNWLLLRFLSLNLYNLQCVLVMFSFSCVCLGFVALIGSVGLQFHQIWKNFGYFLSFLYPTHLPLGIPICMYAWLLEVVPQPIQVLYIFPFFFFSFRQFLFCAFKFTNLFFRTTFLLVLPSELSFIEVQFFLYLS